MPAWKDGRRRRRFVNLERLAQVEAVLVALDALRHAVDEQVRRIQVIPVACRNSAAGFRRE